MNEEIKSYGKITAPDGEFDIIDYIQTETVQGRQWTLSLLSDGSITMHIESTPEGSTEKNLQSMRLSKTTITILQLCLSQADQQFNLQMEKIAKELLADQNYILNFKMPDKDKN
jgi:hypothetical protein